MEQKSLYSTLPLSRTVPGNDGEVKVERKVEHDCPRHVWNHIINEIFRIEERDTPPGRNLIRENVRYSSCYEVNGE